MTEAKEKIFNLVNNIPLVAEKQKWVLTLDRDECTLFYAPKIIPDKSELFQITDEYAIYIDKDFNPQGLVIDYYGVNFVKHHPEFKKLGDDVFGKGREKIKTISLKETKEQDKVAVFKSLIEKTLSAEVMKDELVSWITARKKSQAV